MNPRKVRDLIPAPREARRHARDRRIILRRRHRLNAFTADRKLLAIQSLMQVLGKLPQKKSVIYFSNGITQSDIDNQSALRAATAAAVKANTSIYSLDVRGLQAFPPGGKRKTRACMAIPLTRGRRY